MPSKKGLEISILYVYFTIKILSRRTWYGIFSLCNLCKRNIPGLVLVQRFDRIQTILVVIVVGVDDHPKISDSAIQRRVSCVDQLQ